MAPHDFDKGFDDIAAASSHYAFSARHACSARLRFYGHVLLISQKSLIFGKKEGQGSGRMFLLINKNVAQRTLLRRGLGNGFEGKAFIKIDGFRHTKL